VPANAADVSRAVGEALALVAARAGDIERDRRLPDDVVTALAAAGVNRLALPAALGGLEAPVDEVVTIVERLAGGGRQHGLVRGHRVRQQPVRRLHRGSGTAHTVFADPDQGNATMFAPNGFVPVADITIENTWDALGLRGTGSHHVTAASLPVDPARSCTFADRPWPEGPLWRLPLYLALLPRLAAVPLGIARGAVDEVARQAREGRTARRGQVTDDPVALAALADADTRLRAADAGLRAVVGEAHERAERGDPVDRPLEARTCLACLLACDTGVEVTAAARSSRDPRPAAGQRSVRKLEEAAGQVEELGPQRGVVEVGHQRVHHRAADGGREHRRRDPGVGRGVVAQEDAVEAAHHLPERLVVGEEPHDHRVAQQCALHPPPLDGQVDDAGHQDVPGPVPGRFGLGRRDRLRHPGELRVGRGQDDLLLGPELVVDRRLRHPDGVGDHLQRRAAHAVLGEQVDGSVHDAQLGGRVGRRRRAHGLDATRPPCAP
jgi:alkylation response protein AidB-like acyl-CoA dehydrogenase